MSNSHQTFGTIKVFKECFDYRELSMFKFINSASTKNMVLGLNQGGNICWLGGSFDGSMDGGEWKGLWIRGYVYKDGTAWMTKRAPNEV